MSYLSVSDNHFSLYTNLYIIILLVLRDFCVVVWAKLQERVNVLISHAYKNTFQLQMSLSIPCQEMYKVMAIQPPPGPASITPLSTSHPQILSGILGNKKCLRTEGPSTYNENNFNSNFKIYMHSEESSVSKTSKSYLPAAGIIESEREQTTTSGDILMK